MELDARIKFFHIDKMGFYPRGHDDRQFATVDEILSNLQDWTIGKPIKETATYAPTEEQDDLQKRTFCNEIFTSKDEYIVSTWNEIQGRDGTVASINPTSTVGHTSVTSTALPEGNIPGFAAYYWFLPEKNVYATIQFHNASNARANLRLFLKGFLQLYSKWYVRDPEQPETRIGYSKDGELPLPDLRCWPCFESKEFRKSGQLDYIRRNRSCITKIVRHDILTWDRQEKVDFYQKIYRSLTGREAAQRFSGSKKLKFEMPFELQSDEELDNIISFWEEERKHGNSQQFEDIGFIMQGNSQKIHWLSKSLASEKFTLNIPTTQVDNIPAELLFNAISQSRHEILSLLNEE